jgi:superfamily II DNA helicase RecQ
MHYFMLCNGKSFNMLQVYSDSSTRYQGIDIADVGCIIQYGICQDVPSWRQRGGRAGGNPDVAALFLTLYEPWVLQVNLSNISKCDDRDPDHPVLRLSKNATKQERIGIASIRLMQSNNCIRSLMASYFDNQTETSTYFFAT